MTTRQNRIQQLLQQGQVLCITGAGCSAASGIPTYRDHSASWQRSQPIQHNDFIRSEATRKHYWARSVVGWPKFAQASPNETHRALSQMEQAGWINLLVTQNVDRLHQQAGHRQVVDLHGRLDQVRCLQCDQIMQRALLQTLLTDLNPHLVEAHGEIAPDGDADIPDDLIHDMSLPDCTVCGGTWMPDVVFYGGSVPRQRIDQINEVLNRTKAVLVVGSSLMVFSAFRFCREAHRKGMPVVAINQGATRADDLLDVKLEMDCSQALMAMVP